MPLVSVIIPTYNRAQYLPEAVDSVLRQTFTDFEIIVVDDGSSDNTSGVMQRYAGNARVRFFRTPNGGVAAARNFGLQQARGELVEHLDSDDILEPNDLELKVEALSGLPDDVGGVFTDYYRYLEPGRPAAKTYFGNFDFIGSLADLTDVYDASRKLYLLNRRFYEWHLLQCLITPTILLRRSVYEFTGLYDAAMVGVQDFDFFVSLTRHFRVAAIDIPTMRCRFWIPGDTNIPGRCEEGAIRLYKKHLRIETDTSLKESLRAQIKVEWMNALESFAWHRHRKQTLYCGFRVLVANPSRIGFCIKRCASAFMPQALRS